MKYYLILVLFLFITSCASIKYGEVEYSRFGNQRLEGLEITRINHETGETFIIKINKQDSKTEALNNIIKSLQLMTVP